MMSIFIGAFYLALALVFYFFPAKKINGFYGYRTKLSKKNDELWQFAQMKSRNLILVFALITFVFSCIFRNDSELTVALIMMGSLFLVIVLTERALKKRDNQ